MMILLWLTRVYLYTYSSYCPSGSKRSISM
nr:MAG TPA: hypothetical protein [Bacteriophage sp.]